MCSIHLVRHREARSDPEARCAGSGGQAHVVQRGGPQLLLDAAGEVAQGCELGREHGAGGLVGDAERSDAVAVQGVDRVAGVEPDRVRPVREGAVAEADVRARSAAAFARRPAVPFALAIASAESQMITGTAEAVSSWIVRVRVST